MSAVLSAFVQYIITFILLVAAAAGGIFCGKKLRTKKNMESNTAGTGNTSGIYFRVLTENQLFSGSTLSCRYTGSNI